jgi:hypothetical protein
MDANEKDEPDIMPDVKFSIRNISQVTGWTSILRGKFAVDE